MTNVRTPRLEGGGRRRGEERHDHGSNVPIRDGGRGPSSRQQLQSQGQPGRVADDVIDPGRGLGSLLDRLRAHLHQAAVQPGPVAARSGRRRAAGRRPGRRRAGRVAVRPHRAPGHVPLDHDPLRRLRLGAGVRAGGRLADRRAPRARPAARERHLQQLRLHHGNAAEGRARSDGQPMAVHVRARRSIDHRGRHPAHPPQSSERDGLARDARPGRGSGVDHPAPAAQPPGNGDLADPQRSVPRGEARQPADVR